MLFHQEECIIPSTDATMSGNNNFETSWCSSHKKLTCDSQPGLAKVLHMPHDAAGKTETPLIRYSFLGNPARETYATALLTLRHR